MKLEHKPTEIKTSKQFQELEFGIREADFGLILEILRSKMYKNPIGAICREVASNSRDANREAENNIPIEIAISDNKLLASDITIQFKDYGPGISPERMANVFINYGASTKRESNEYTGGFGLGAKTPFSYSDNFAIETIHDGIHYSWIAAVEDGRKGKIFMIDSHDTSEPSGTTIIVPIKAGDRETFEREVFKASAFWPMRPIYKNFRVREEDLKFESILDDEKFLLVKQNFFNAQYGLLLDGIFYNIDSNIMNFAYQSVYEHMIIFKFNTGDLTISANREALQYDDKTKDAIQKRFNELLVLCYANFKAAYDLNKTWLEAALFWAKREKQVFYKILSQHQNKEVNKLSSWDGISLRDGLTSIFGALQFFKCEIDLSNKISRTKTNDVDEYLKIQPCFLFDESLGYHALKDATIFKNNKKYVAIKPIDAKLLKWKELSFKEKKGLSSVMRTFTNNIKKLTKLGFSFSNYSLVEKAKIDKKDPNAKDFIPRTRSSDTIKICLFDFAADNQRSNRYRDSNKNYNYQYLTVEEDGIKFENASAQADTSKLALVLVEDIMQVNTNLSEELLMIKLATKMSLINPFRIVYANKNRGKMLVDFIKPLTDFMKLLTDDIITEIIDAHHIREIMNDSTSKLLLSLSYDSKEFDSVVKSINKIGSSKTSVYVPDNLIKKYATLSKYKDMANELEKIKKTFPLISSSGYYSNAKKDINYYVNLVEADLIKKGELK